MKLWLRVLRILIIVLNVFILIVGVATLAAGFFLRDNPDGLAAILIDRAASTQTPYVQYTGDLIAQVGAAVEPVLLSLALFGLVITAISLFGIIAASCLIKRLLIIYAIFLGLLVLGLIVAIIVLATQNQFLIDLLATKFASYIPNYQGINGTNMESGIWNFIMSQAKCCGINSGADFGGTNMVICCSVDDSQSLVDPTCATTQTTANSFYFTGCLTPLSAEFLGYIRTINICVAVGVGIEAALFTWALMLALCGF